MNELCELCHSLSSESAAKRLEIPALVEVNLSGEETKSGVPEGELEDFLGLYENVRGLMTMPPDAGDPEASRPYFRRLRELAESYGLPELSMGTSQDYRVAADEGATMVRLGIRSLPRLTFENHGICRRLEPNARLLRDRRGGRRLGRGRLPHRGGPRAHLQRAPERPPSDPAGAPAGLRRLDRPRPGGSGASGPPSCGLAAATAGRPRRHADARRAVRAGAPRRAAQLQRRPADRGQVQGRRSR